MKKIFSKILITFLMGCCIYAFAQGANALKFADIFDRSINPIEGKILEVVESNDFNKDLFDQNVATPPRTYKVYFSGKNIHQQEKFPIVRNGKSSINIRDIYLHDNIVYCIDSLGGASMRIWDLDNLDVDSPSRVMNMFLSYFDKAKTLLKSEIPCGIKENNGQYIVAYDVNNEKHLLFIDSKTLLPTHHEIRLKNGNIVKITKISTNKDFFTINTLLYASKEKAETPDKWAINSQVTIKVIEDTKFDKNTKPQNFGYRSILDQRNGRDRNYEAFNTLPDSNFLDQLFKNQDDVVRYNIEIHRLAHPLEFEEE